MGAATTEGSDRPGRLRLMRWLILLVSFIALFGEKNSEASCTWVGNTGTASAATPESILSCLNDITSSFSGIVDIIIPAGSPTWSSNVRIDMTDVSNPAPNFINVTKLNIIGAGIDLTTISDGLPSHGYQVALFSIIASPGKVVRLGEMTINGNHTSTTNGLIYVSGKNGEQTFRLAHMKFLNYDGGRAIKIDGYTYGLVDNNIFIGGGHSLDVFGDGPNSWLRSATLGTGNAVYVENNTFDFTVSGMSDGVTDGYSGGRYVFRYNNVMGTNIGHHGNDSGNFRSVHTFEIYNNSFTNTSSKDIFTWGNFRGGTGVIFDNTISAGTKTYNSFVILHNYRSCPYFEGVHDGGDLLYLSDSTADFSTGSQGALANGHYVYNLTAGSYCRITSHTDSGPATAVCTLAGGTRQTWKNGDHYGVHYIQNDALLCNGYAAGIDGNVGFEGYPCQDQIGRTTNQTLEPLYQWGNNYLGGMTPTMTNGGTCARELQHIVSGTDYINNTSKPGYSPYTYPHPLSAPDPARNMKLAQ